MITERIQFLHGCMCVIQWSDYFLKQIILVTKYEIILEKYFNIFEKSNTLWKYSNMNTFLYGKLKYLKKVFKYFQIQMYLTPNLFKSIITTVFGVSQEKRGHVAGIQNCKWHRWSTFFSMNPKLEATTRSLWRSEEG